MRKLASIRKIDSIDPIEGADAIEVATVGGWKVVVQKNEYKPGDTAIYCEIDSWIPHDLAPFLSKGKEPREFNGVKGERLRTIKLRGQISQGLLLKGTQCPTGLMVHRPDSMAHIFQEDDDVSQWLNIKKWEAPVPVQLAGTVKGNFPTVIPKTDQERCQNLVKEIAEASARVASFEITEKLEGSSMTCYLIDGVFGVCSRNLDLKQDENNAFWSVAISENIEAKMREMGDNFAIQGELIGPGIQGNIYKLSKLEFYLFDIYDIIKGQYVSPPQRREYAKKMSLKHVPILNSNILLCDFDIKSIIEYAEGESKLFKTQREGIVFKEINGTMTFKAISNKYLLGLK
jgi:RNA ligase (TIGR02306 family)